ncbi:uncharacterized protein V6R79_022632 [Siganus canaliculatus]
MLPLQSCVFLNGPEHNATVKCNRMKSQKVRRRPESCHAYHPKVPWWRRRSSTDGRRTLTQNAERRTPPGPDEAAGNTSVAGGRFYLGPKGSDFPSFS